MFPLELKISFY